MKNFCNIQPLVDKMGIRHDMWDGALWKTSRAGGARGSAEIMGAGGGTVGSTVGELWLGVGILRSMACGWDMASWRSEVGILRVGGACAMSIGDLRFGAGGLGLAVCDLGLGFAVWTP